MTLPTGQISLSQVNTELGLSSTAQISLNDAAVRSLAGISSGQISMNDLRGKSSVTFNPAGGTSGSPGYAEASSVWPFTAGLSITCSQSATWTYTKDFGGAAAYASLSSGSSGTSISFYLESDQYTPRVAGFSVSATAGGITKYWSVYLSTESYA